MLTKLKEKYLSLGAPIRASLWFTICSFVQKGISFITVPIFTRLMSAEQYGMYSLYLSWDSVLIIFATLNLSYQVFNNGLVRFERDRDGYTTSMLGLSNVCTTVLLVLYLVFRGWVNAATGLSTLLFMLMFAQYYFNQALALWTVEERFFYRYRALTAITLASAVASSAIGVAAVFLAEDKVFARIATLAVVNVIVGAGIYILLLKRSHRLVNLKYWRYVLKLNLPLIPHYLSMTALSSSDRILISRICGAAYTAYYSVSYNVASVLNLLTSSINSSFIPWFYQKMSKRSYAEISRVSTMLLVIVGACSLLPALFGPEIVLVLGSEAYMEGVWVMPAVSVGVYFTFLYSLFSNFELYHEESRLIMVASLSAAVINIALNIVLLPVFGFVAAGYTTLICYIALSIFHYLGARRVSRARGDGSLPFDLRAIVVVSVAIVVLSIGVTFTYFNTVVRYVTLVCLLAVMLLKRGEIAGSIRGIRGDK
ncbi:oligosaccharide flippase family protein [Olsenella profusa]|uniref:Oligosaccharide flippase family protein n=1 Tax=Olsenella profusa TaxID=138595 RepID=A0ABS2F3T3_9ACTN|nr:oligosaccharide flippase family protein [Olsenella profusa]MBM6775483.1 oligosaccharide flippase family protein [Olsenella profusa]